MAKKTAPQKGDPKVDWVAHAIDQGIPSYEAWAMTKPELVKHFTGEDAPDDEPEPAPKPTKGKES